MGQLQNLRTRPCNLCSTISEKTSYDADLERAKKLSAEEHFNNEKRQAHSRECIYPLLKERNLFRVPIAGDGNCQFVAVIKSGNLNISHFDLSQEVVNHLRQFPDYFSAFAAGFHNFDAYLNYMSVSGNWGDHLP